MTPTYEAAYKATKKAMAKTLNEHGDYSYKGYDGVNAVALYVDDKYGINVNALAFSHDGFCDALANK